MWELSKRRLGLKLTWWGSSEKKEEASHLLELRGRHQYSDQRSIQNRAPAEISLWKRAGCQTESIAFEKSIVARIVREPGLGLLNPSEMD